MVTASKGGRRVPIGVLSAFADLAALIAALPHGSRAPLSIARWLQRPAATSWQQHSSWVDGGNQSSSRLAGRPSNNPAPRSLLRLRTRRATRRNGVHVYSRLASPKPKAPAHRAGAPAPSRAACTGWETGSYSPWAGSRDLLCSILISYAYDLNSRSSTLNRFSD